METGLQLYPSTPADTNIISGIIEESALYAEYDARYGFFFFPEKEEDYDELEKDIDALLAGAEVNYRIEGIF